MLFKNRKRLITICTVKYTFVKKFFFYSHCFCIMIFFILYYNIANVTYIGYSCVKASYVIDFL